jgi:2-oxoglutarate dehydrogenase complex dehydrogenase (E1) component-like enzyme
VNNDVLRQEFSKRVAKKVAARESLNSDEIQQAIYDWALAQDFTAPYGVLEGKHTSVKGRPYKSVTFGRARTLDATVLIFNRNFIVVKTNRHGDQQFNSYDSVMKFLETL